MIFFLSLKSSVFFWSSTSARYFCAPQNLPFKIRFYLLQLLEKKRKKLNCFLSVIGAFLLLSNFSYLSLLAQFVLGYYFWVGIFIFTGFYNILINLNK